LPIKTMGALAFAALAALALMLNLFAADWRDQLAAEAGRQVDLGSDASFHFWSLLPLDSPQAIILLMLGAGVWVFAARGRRRSRLWRGDPTQAARACL